MVCVASLLLGPSAAQQAPAKRDSKAILPAPFNMTWEIKTIVPTPGSRSLRVISWNIDRGYQLDQVVSEIANQPVDLCLLQEFDWGTTRVGNADVGAELARRLHLDLAYAVAFEELSQGRSSLAYTGQATLMRLPLRRSRVLRFENQSSFWKPHSWLPSSLPLMQRWLGSWVALVTDLEFAGQPLIVYNAHLESRSYERIQMNQMDEILADLKSHYLFNTPGIIGGDLNTKCFLLVFLHKLPREGFYSVIGERIERSHTIAMALELDLHAWVYGMGKWGSA